MSEEFSVVVKGVSKVFSIYERPIDRLKESLNIFGRSYSRDFQALQSLSFELKQGESFGILGLNGAGKSTLLKIITGVLTPTTGSVKLNGKVSSLLELGTGFDPELTGSQNIFLYGSLMGIEKLEMKSRFDDIVNFANIGDFIEQPVKTYSSGMFARLAFAAAINVTPKILIVDEVLSVGDAAFQKKCVQRINELRESGVTIILVSHDEYLVRQLCQTAMFLDRGECKFYGAPDLCLAEYKTSIQSNGSGPSNIKAGSQVVNSEHQFSLSISNILLKDAEGKAVSQFKTGSDINVSAEYHLSGMYDGFISFVANLYGADGAYIWGTTTLMQELPPQKTKRNGLIELSIKEIPLLSGKYTLRLAINDDTGLCIFCEANPAAEFTVVDDFQSVGLIKLEHEWGL